MTVAELMDDLRTHRKDAKVFFTPNGFVGGIPQWASCTVRPEYRYEEGPDGEEGEVPTGRVEITLCDEIPVA